MSVVSPVASVTAAGVPLAVDAVLGVSLSRWGFTGVLAGLVAVVLLARETGPYTSSRPALVGALFGLLAGGGYAAMYLALGQAGGEGLWPATCVYIAIVTATLAALLTRRERPLMPVRLIPGTIVVGLLGAVGTAAFVFAARAGPVGIASVLTEMSPGVTVVLAVTILRERLTIARTTGLLLAACAIALITTT